MILSARSGKRNSWTENYFWIRAHPIRRNACRSNLASFRFHFRGCLCSSRLQNVFTFHTCTVRAMGWKGGERVSPTRGKFSALERCSWKFDSVNLSSHYRANGSHHALLVYVHSRRYRRATHISENANFRIQIFTNTNSCSSYRAENCWIAIVGLFWLSPSTFTRFVLG